MSLAQITEKIKNDAQQEADEFIAEAKAQADLVTQKASKERDAIKADLDHRFGIERPEIFHRSEIVADLDVKKMMLKAKRDLISDVYAQALSKMKNMDREQYLGFCEDLLNSSVSTKEEKIEVSADEKFIDKAWLDSYNAKHSSKLTLSDKKPDISGGFILANGKTSINCSWDMLLQVAQEKQEAGVVERLFPQTK